MINHDSPSLCSQSSYSKLYITLGLTKTYAIFQNSLTRNLTLHATHLGKRQSEIKTAGLMLRTVIQFSTMGDHPVSDKMFYYSS